MDLAAGTIFLAGVFTFASPCVLPLIPIYLSVLLGGSLDSVEERPTGRLRLLANGLFFVLGFTTVFVALGMTATAIGRFLAEHRLLFQQIGGLLVFLFGLKFLGWLRIEALEQEKRFQLAARDGISPPGAFVMGLTFAFGWTPCIGPVLGAVLTFTAVSAPSMAGGAFYLLLYALGVGLPLLAVALLAQPGVRLLNRVKRHIPRIEKATGAVLVAMAVLMVTDSTSILTFGIGDDSSEAISTELVARTTAAADDPSAPGDAGEELLAEVDGDAVADLPAASGGTCGPTAGCGLGEEPVFTAETGGEVTLPEGPLVVNFHRPDCPACLTMEPVLQAMEHTCAAKGMKLVRLDVSEPSNRSFAAKKGVLGTPTLLFIDEDGKEVSRLVGAVDLPTLHQSLAVLMGRQCAEFSPI